MATQLTTFIGVERHGYGVALYSYTDYFVWFLSTFYLIKKSVDSFCIFNGQKFKIWELSYYEDYNVNICISVHITMNFNFM